MSVSETVELAALCLGSCTVCRLGHVLSLDHRIRAGDIQLFVKRLPLPGRKSHRACYHLLRIDLVRIDCKPLGSGEGSRNRDRDILAFSAVLPLSFVISHGDMVPLMSSTAASLHAPLVWPDDLVYMMPPADTGARRSVPDADTVLPRSSAANEQARRPTCVKRGRAFV